MNILNNYNKIQLTQTFILIWILFVWVKFFWLYLDIYKIITVFFSVIIFDLVLSYIFTNNFSGILNLSKINISFWILFFLRTDIIFIYIITSFIAVISKYIFIYKNRHFFNPSNFWVSIILLFFAPYAYTNPLQWWFFVSEKIYLLFFIIVIILWLIVIQFFLHKNLKFNQIPLILSFVFTHLFLYNIVWLDEWFWSYVDFFSITFLIFTFFMITDPKTTPSFYVNKILFWSSIAIVFYILSYFTNENFNLLWSLFIMTLFLPLIWNFEDKNNKYIPLIFITLILILLIVSLYFIYGNLDLQFTNRCISVFCK